MGILKEANKEKNMHLEYTHDSDYFFFSQLLMRHIENYVRKTKTIDQNKKTHRTHVLPTLNLPNEIRYISAL